MLFDFEGLINLTFLLYHKRKQKTKKVGKNGAKRQESGFQRFEQRKSLKNKKIDEFR